MSRAGKSGDAYATEKKFEEKYDAEEQLGTPQNVMEWINTSMAGEKDFVPNTFNSWDGIKDYLKDGTVLCRLINKLRAAAGMGPVKFKANAKMAFAMMNNVENFSKGAGEYGVPTSALFQTADLVEGRKGPMVNVINCLNQLGFAANEKGFTPKYSAPAAPKADI